jgi:hypothetical protein
MPRALAIALLSLVLSFAVARADTLPVVLRFQGPGAVAGCPDAAALRERVTSLVAGPAFVEAGPRVAAVDVRSVGDALSAEVVVTVDGAPAGERRLETVTGDCPALMASVALSLVLFIDPVRGAVLATAPQEPIVPPAPPSEPPAPPSAAPAPPTEPPAPPSDPPAPPSEAPPPPPASSWTLALQAGPAATAGLAPGVSPAADVGVVAATGPFAAALHLRGQWPATLARDGGTVRGTTVGLEPLACGVLARFEGCAAALAGLLRAEGSGYSHSDARWVGLLYAGARVSYVLPVGEALDVVAAAEALTPLARATLLVDGATVWRSPALAGSALVDLRWRFSSPAPRDR